MLQTTDNFQAVLFDGDENPHLLKAVQQFRKRLFIDKLGWELNADGTHEVDEFDRPDAIHCALLQYDQIVGCFRAIRTDRDYLAASVFPELATLRAYPKRMDSWEISRFGTDSGGVGLRASLANYALMFHFARSRRASALVAIIDLSHERLLRRLSIKTRRYGPPAIVGHDCSGNMFECVAGEIPIHEQSPACVAFFKNQMNFVELNDETLVQRSQRLSA